MTIRTRATPAPLLASISAHELSQLRNHGAGDHTFWGTDDAAHKPLIDAYKVEVKLYYYWRQNSRCTYCSFLLDHTSRSFDYDHILCKSIYPQFMFHPENAAASCITCNSKKKAQNVLSAPPQNPQQLANIPNSSGDYIVVHPGLDDWATHLEHDQLGRVVARDNKGRETIRICAIGLRNAAQLASAFSPARAQDAHTALGKYFTLRRKSKREEYLRILEDIAANTQLAEAISIVQTLRAEFDAEP